MLGWVRLAAVRASCVKRSSRSRSSLRSKWSSLSATRRRLHLLMASKTDAVPPRPISRTTSYLPAMVIAGDSESSSCKRVLPRCPERSLREDASEDALDGRDHQPPYGSQPHG